MTHNISEEKIKPFRLVKYFTFTSLVLIFLGTLIISVLNTHWARTMQLKQSEDYALVLVENLNHQIFLQFVIPIALKYGKIQLRNKEQFERMDKIVKNTLHRFKIELVNIYDLNHIISYSFNQEMVGKKNMGGKEYDQAISGKSVSKSVEGNNFFKLLLGFPQKSKILTFAPLRAEKPLSTISGPVLGVVEIVQDLSDDYETIFKFQIRVITTSTLVMGILFFMLIFVVKRGESIIEKKNLERIKLKEKLSHAERLSSLGEMVAGISHEIRNPLGIIKNSAELLKKKMANYDPSNTIPDIIVEESNRLNRIITDFLDYAKPRKPNLVPCKIEKILEKNITFLKSQTDAYGYAIEQYYETLLPEIMADYEMLYQAFLNILINAMQAMPGGGRIQIEIASNNEIIILSFKDQGIGIPQEIMGKIWNPFFTTKETGTGLGLGIVKNIIESHNGTIHIYNRPLQGAEVVIELPLKP